MRWSPILKELAVSGEPEDLIVLDEGTVPTVNILSLRTTKDVLLHFGPSSVEMTSENSFLLLAGEGYSETGITISDRIRFLNAVAGERPLVRGIVWGK